MPQACADTDSAGFAIGKDLLEAPWAFPSTKHSLRAACEVQPAGPWNVSSLDMPPVALAASRAIDSSSASRLQTFLDKLGSDGDCCTSVLVVGGSVPCGHGHPGCGGAKVMFPNATGAGLHGAWPAWLNRWLNWSRPSCCPSGHVVRNLCVGATGIDYVLNTFQTRVLPALAEMPTQLVVVDTAVNDYNEYFYVKRCQWKRCIPEGERLKKEESTKVLTEALVRRLIQLNLSVAFVENARFRGGVSASDTTYGAWKSHEPILRHYNIPTVHLGLAAESAEKDPVARPDLWAREWTHVDGQHLSAGGHWTMAMLLARGVLCHEWRHTHRQGSLRLAQPLMPPPIAAEGTLESLIGARSVPRTIIDFTDKRGLWNKSVTPPEVPSGSTPSLENVWMWTTAVRRASGGYSLLPVDASLAALPTEETQKLSFSVRAAVPCTFDARVSFVLGWLRIGYLRSYEGQASIEVQVFIPPSSSGVANASWVVNGTWEDTVSIYTTDEFELSESLQGKLWPKRCGYYRSRKCQRWTVVPVHERWSIEARIRITSVPRALKGSHSWAPFSLYTVSSI